MRHGGSRLRTAQCHFNPRIPYGMRLSEMETANLSTLFQSTHPLRDATGCVGYTGTGVIFQSTHPLRDATSYASTLISTSADFNPRIPYGMRLPLTISLASSSLFQSTHPLRDATLTLQTSVCIRQFQSTHPLRDATVFGLCGVGWYYISIHASLTGCAFEQVKLF